MKYQKLLYFSKDFHNFQVSNTGQLGLESWKQLNDVLSCIQVSNIGRGCGVLFIKGAGISTAVLVVYKGSCDGKKCYPSRQFHS